MRVSTLFVGLAAAIVLAVLSAGSPVQAGGLHAAQSESAVELGEPGAAKVQDQIGADDCHDAPECNISVVLSSASHGQAYIAASSKKRRVSPSLFKLLYSMTDPPVPRSLS